MGNHLPVGARAEAMTARLKLDSELLVIVDLAVEDNVNRPRLVSKRLRAPVHVDDRQPAHAERDVPLAPKALAIRSAVSHSSHQALQNLAISRNTRREDAGDAAH